MNPYHEKYLGIKSIDKKSPFFLCPLFSYVVLKKIVNLKYSSLFDEFEYKLGREYSKILCNIQKKKKITGSRGIKGCLEEFKNFGFGNTKVILISQEKILLKNHSSPIALQYKKSFDTERIKTDYLLSGLYSGVISSHLDDDIHIAETACITSGNRNCFFEDVPYFLNRYTKLNKVIENTIKFHRIRDHFINYPTQLIKTAFEQGHFNKKEGVIKLWNIYSVFFKFGFFAFSSYMLTKLYADIADLYRYLGIVQARIAAQFQRNQYGIKSKNKIFDSLIKQLDLFGYGHGNILYKDRNEILLEFKNVNILRQCLSFMKTFKDPYIEGVLIGDCTILDDNVSNIEIKKKKKEELLVRVEFGGKDNLLEKINRKIDIPQIKKIVNEKMKHKYYLSPE